MTSVLSSYHLLSSYVSKHYKSCLIDALNIRLNTNEELTYEYFLCGVNHLSGVNHLLYLSPITQIYKHSGRLTAVTNTPSTNTGPFITMIQL